MKWAQQPDPELPRGHVLVEVAATAVNRADLLQRQGFYPPPPGASDILGLECSGVITELGEDVTGLVRRRRSLRIAGRRWLRREGCGPGNTTSPGSRWRRSPCRSVPAGSCVHGVVQRRDARRSTTRTGPPRPWRWRRNRHPRHPGRQSPRRPRRSYRGFGGQIEPLPRIGRGYSHQLSRQRLRSITRRSHRQPRRRRGSGQHGSVVPSGATSTHSPWTATS